VKQEPITTPSKLSAEELAEISRSIELGYLDQHGLQKCRALFAHISALDRELAEARKDSERLDWQDEHFPFHSRSCSKDGHYLALDGMVYHGANLRAAIDAAQHAARGGRETL